MSNREEFVAAMREVADFIESHPNVPVPEGYSGIRLYASVETVDELRAAFHLSGPWAKEYQGETAVYKKEFGPQPENNWSKGSHITYQVSLPREQVCVKRVVGQEWVPPAPSYAQTTGYYRDVVEWDCM